MQARMSEAELLGWLVEAGLSGFNVSRLLQEFCERLNALNVPVARAYIGLATLHPMVRAYGFTWLRQGGLLDADALPHAQAESAAWLESPFRHMLETNKVNMRRRLCDPSLVPDFPVLAEFKANGMTDWLAKLFEFGWRADNLETEEMGIISSWVTDQAGGFDADQVAMLDRLTAAFALCIKGITTFTIAHGLLSTYIGVDPARRVLAGRIRRGSVERLNAVMFFADLRGFTQLADQVPIETVVALLDDYMDRIGLPVQERGGQVLKFLGDGLLATFPLVPGEEPAICQAALEAAIAALRDIESFNAKRTENNLPALRLDIALHLGEVLYGNVGTAERLDFTIVGPAVNEASRLEALCGELGHHLLASETFFASLGGAQDRLVSVGMHQLRGVSRPREVFALAGSYSAAAELRAT